MKIAKKDIKGFDAKTLDAKLVEVRDELMKISAQSASGANPKDLNAIKNLKKTIARILTQKRALERGQ